MPGHFGPTSTLHVGQTAPSEGLGRNAPPTADRRRAARGDNWAPVVDVGGAIFGAGTLPADGSRVRLDARLVHLTPGPFDLSALVPEAGTWSGFLILDGLVLLELEAGRGQAAWLVGADDLLVSSTLGELPLAQTSRWRTLAPTWVALLDPSFTAAGRGVPGLTPWLISRAARSTTWLLAKSLVMACPVVEERLLLLFALYAERWGVVRPDGILLRLPLTHRLLGALCGVRRPSVTIAIRSLDRAGVLKRLNSGAWLLMRDQARWTESNHSCGQAYSAALGFASE